MVAYSSYTVTTDVACNKVPIPNANQSPKTPTNPDYLKPNH